MKLLFVIDNLGSGGAQRQLVNLALGFVKLGHIVQFFIYYPQFDFFETTLKRSNIEIHKCEKKAKYDPTSIATLHRLIKKEGFDVVLSFLDTPNLYCELAGFGIGGSKLVVAERSSYPITGPSFFKRITEIFHLLADKVVVNSYYQAQQMIHFSPWLEKRIVVVYNGLDISLYSNQSVNTKKTNTLLAVGSVIPNKNAVGLANALVEYKKNYGNPPKIDWAGAIYSDAGSQNVYNTVNKILQENSLEKNWEWLGEQEKIYSLYPNYLALIHPSFREGLPNVVCEAMACGLPVLLSDFGEHRRLVDGGANGILFDPNSPSDIAKAINSFQNKTDIEQKSLGLSARRFAENEFAQENSVNHFQNLFSSLINH